MTGPKDGGSGGGAGSRRSGTVDSGFQDQRPRLLLLAYRMLGTWAEAEDVVGDVAERWLRADRDGIADPDGWLTTVTSRRALDVLGSARVQRVDYPGEWLPEPVATGLLPAEVVDQRESLTLGFLTLLERLTPIERAVLVLYDVVGWDHAAIATALDRRPTAVRQALSRARRHIGQAPSRPVDPELLAGLLDRLLQALSAGDGERLARLLAPDAVAATDGGGVVPATVRSVVGRNQVTRFLLGLARRSPVVEVNPAEINGGPAFVLHDGDHWSTVVVETDDDAAGRADRLFIVRNPVKLARLLDGLGLDR
ncbi:MAG: sigma factor-like helix-turn-helix DNA-binding protein [Acidimicrobiales bacterium]